MKKSILMLGVLVSLVMFIGCASSKYIVYDEIEPGDGKSPIRLQLKNGKYVEADWQYPQYYRIVNFFGKYTFIMAPGDLWQYCDTGKDCMLVLNYNPNNNNFMIGSSGANAKKYNEKMFRPYTVEELETLIGVKTYTDEEDSWKYFGPELKIESGESSLVFKIQNRTNHPLKVQEYIQEKDIVAHTKEVEIPAGKVYIFRNNVDDVLTLCSDSTVDSVQFVFEYQIEDKKWYRGGSNTLEKSFLKDIKGSYNPRNIIVRDDGQGAYTGDFL